MIFSLKTPGKKTEKKADPELHQSEIFRQSGTVFANTDQTACGSDNEPTLELPMIIPAEEQN